MSQLKNRAASLSTTARWLALAAAMSVLCTLAMANPPCPGDLDGDGEIGGGDLAMLLLDWGGLCPEDPPSLTAVSPAFGPREGGTTITISGTSLAYARQVKIGGVVATNFVVLNETTVSAVTPPGVGGSANVTVTTVGGNTASLGGAFTYFDDPAWCTVLALQPDPAVIYDAGLRQSILATGLPWRVRDNGSGIEMVLIPPGTFTMGNSPSNVWSGQSWEFPVHQVTLTKPFYLGRTEVTQAQWVAKMGGDPNASNNLPVYNVNWGAAQQFCASNRLRLPTEAEWEYACRAGTVTAFHGWLAEPRGTNYDTESGNIFCRTCYWPGAVGARAANGFGLYDMLGNVWEWVSDFYGVYSPDAQTNPAGPSSGTDHVLRGGDFLGTVSTQGMRSSCRSYLGSYPDMRPQNFGFRVVRDP